VFPSFQGGTNVSQEWQASCVPLNKQKHISSSSMKVHNDKKLTICEIAEEEGISYSSCVAILTDLGMTSQVCSTTTDI
jgi:hypothetical protein